MAQKKIKKLGFGTNISHRPALDEAERVIAEKEKQDSAKKKKQAAGKK